MVGVGACDRKRDLVNVAWLARIKESPGIPTARLAENYWCDVSQSVCRKPWGAKLQSFRPNSQIYSFERDRVLKGSDCCRVRGLPMSLLQGTSQADLLQLATDATSLPLSVIVQSAMWANPFGAWRTETA